MLDSDQSRQLQQKLEAGASQLAIELSQQQITTLINFLGLLSKWNRVYNLTAVRAVNDMVGRHILDSLSVLSWLPEQTVTKPFDAKPLDTKQNTTPSVLADVVVDVLDVGTGAGLPVIPLAILRPDLQFLSVESNGKKTRFQQQAIVELALSNVNVEQARIEDVHAKANMIVSRAFSAPEKFLHAVDKNCVDNSRVIIMLGLKEKMPANLPEGFELVEMKQLDVPQCESVRHIAVCDNTKPE